MVTFYDEIVPELHEFIIKQPVFFTGSAPLHLPKSHVNVSPKGYADSTFTITNSRCVWYQDATGSGIPTHNGMSDTQARRRLRIYMITAGSRSCFVRSARSR
jgi:hypothetical protein